MEDSHVAAVEAPTQTPPSERAPAAAGGTSGTPPSNTVPDNSNVPIRPLRFGVDSLYLSYRGSLLDEREEQLQELKAAAQSDDPAKVFLAQIRLGEHVFEVKDRGAGRFAYVLEDNAFRIALSRSSATSLPMAYVKVSAHLLASAQPQDIETTVRAMLGELGLIQGPPHVSRVDLYVDFTSPCDMESWTRNAWVGRAANVHFHAVDGIFSGWSLGLRGPISARLYDKTLEITVSGKQWIYELWRERGWNGTDRVWRLEFQLRRDVLDSLTSVEFAAVLKGLPSIWTYCTVDWLRLCIPNPADSTRARWPLHPLWAAMQQIDWGAPTQPLSRQFRSDRAPQTGHVLRQVMGWVCTFLALRGVYELGPGLDLLANELNWHLSERAEMVGIAPRQLVFEQVAKRVRKFNLDMNSEVIQDEGQERRQADELAQAADAYRRASRGY